MIQKKPMNKWKKLILMVVGFFFGNLLFLHFFFPNSYDSVGNFTVANIWGTTIWMTQAYGNSYVFRWLDKKMPWKAGMGKRALANVLGIGLYSTVAFLLVQFVMYFLFIPNVNWSEMWHDSIRATQLTLTISFTISFILTFIGFGKSMIANEVEKEKLQTKMVKYKYDALKNQINPHFLFNSFNVLSELIYENQELAEEFVHQLSELYRYVLEARDKELVTVNEELEFIERFVFLLKTRFEERVHFSMEVLPCEDKYVVPMSLQLLIENCIKHNIATKQSPLYIKVLDEGEYLTVINNLQLKNTSQNSPRVGLQNLEERYAYFTHQAIEVIETTDSFTVKIPLIEIQ